MLSKLFGHISRRTSVLLGSHVPSSNTAAVVTLAATAARQHVMHHIQWSYDAAPAAGSSLAITVNAVQVWKVYISAAGPGGFAISVPGGTNQAIVATLAAGGSGVSGSVNLQYTTEAVLSY